MLSPAIGFDSPRGARSVVKRAFDGGVERDSAAQIELVGNPIQVAFDLLLRRHQLGPVPLLLEVGELREHVLDGLDVHPGARVAVPVPRSADAVAALEHADSQPRLPQLVQRVEAGESSADHHNVYIRSQSLGRRERSTPPLPFCYSSQVARSTSEDHHPRSSWCPLGIQDERRTPAPPLVATRRTTARLEEPQVGPVLTGTRRCRIVDPG